MIKQVFIINGSGGVGKDEFVKMISNSKYKHELLGESADKKKRVHKQVYEIGNYSSVSKVKEIAKIIGWDGSKSERDRKFLSDLKLLTIEYNDMPLKDMKEFVISFMANERLSRIVFLHVREPEEITKAINEFKEYNAKSILVKRDSVKHIASNMADENVYNYKYDIVIDNSGTLEELKEKADCFINDCLINNLKTLY